MTGRWYVEQAPLAPGEYYIKIYGQHFDAATEYAVWADFSGRTLDYRGDYTGDGATDFSDYQAVVAAWQGNPGVAGRANQIFDSTDDGWLDGWDLLEAYALAAGDPAAEEQEGMADVDADGSVGALTDGLLLVRHEVGMRSETLTAGALGGAAARAAAADLERFMRHTRPLYDIDGDLWLLSPADRTILLRYMLGFRGESLIEGLALDPAAERATAAAIEAYLASLLPPGRL